MTLQVKADDGNWVDIKPFVIHPKVKKLGYRQCHETGCLELALFVEGVTFDILDASWYITRSEWENQGGE